MHFCLYGRGLFYKKFVPLPPQSGAPSLSLGVGAPASNRNEHVGMRVVLINTSERIGGAAIAANRLMEALKRHGVKAQMLVRDRQTQQLTVAAVRPSWLLPLKFLWERLVILLNNGLRTGTMWLVDIGNTGVDVTQMPEFKQADVVHLHWVNQAFISLKGLQRILDSGKPVVVTMHDMWYFTGVCHYAGSCERYKSACTRCPLMGRFHVGGGLAKRVFRRKQRMYARGPITFVGCSQWMADMAQQSALVRDHQIVSIPNAINTDSYAPEPRQAAREAFGLPADKRLVLFSSQRITDERKGFRLLSEALRRIVQEQPEMAKDLALVVVGGEAERVRNSVPLPVFPINYVSKEAAMVQLYNAVDVFVTPSLQDNLPNTIVEALACGTPCVGFAVGGIPEMIDHQQNGYVAAYRDAADLARGILWTLDPSRQERLSKAARQKALETYSEEQVAAHYTRIYETALLRHHSDIQRGPDPAADTGKP